MRNIFYHKLSLYRNQRGAVLLLTSIILASVSVLAGFLWQRVGGFVYTEGKAHLEEKVLAITEGALDKAIWSLNQDSSYTGETETALGDGVFTTIITDIDGSTKRIVATGYIPNATDPIIEKTLEIEAINSGSDISFHYGMQAGEGGIILANNNDIQGSVYSNGDIHAGNNSEIIGDVWVAGSANPDTTVSYEQNGGGASVGNGLNFDGDDQVQAGTFDVTPGGTGNDGLTLEAWVFAESFVGPSKDGRIISKSNPNWTGNNDEEYHWWQLTTIKGAGNQPFLRFRLKTNSGDTAEDGTAVLIATSGALTTNRWYHVAATYDGSKMRLYVDGVLVGQMNKTGRIKTDPTMPVWIGQGPNAYAPWDGVIDEVRVWNVARTQAQIQTYMTQSVNPADSNLVAYWPFNDGSGQVAQDATSYNRDGQLGSTAGTDGNDPTWVAGYSLQPQGYTFGDASARRDPAQSFIATSTGIVNEVSVLLKKTGNPSNLTLRLVSSSGGNPGGSGQQLASGTLNSSWVTTAYNWITVDLSSAPTLTTGQTYWIVLDGGSNATNYYQWAGDVALGYASGQAKVSSNWSSGGWSNVSYDLNFRVVIGGNNTGFYGTNNVAVDGDLHANRIENVSVTGGAYYQSTNNVSAGSYHPGSADPPQLDFPISQAQIDDWKADAGTGGTHVGDYSTCNSTIGPLKITGNLTLSNNCSLTITGTLWVQGDMTLDNNNIVRLDSSYGGNGGVIVTSGRALLSNNNQLRGSGQGDSFVLLISEYSNLSNPAITLDNNNITEAILYAKDGKVLINNSSQMLEITAHTIELQNNVDIIFEEGLTDATISGGTSTGWAMRDGTWVER